MSGANQRPGGIIEGINVTPLVDITLVLLIIFMVTAKFVVTPAVPLDLPTASQTEEVQTIFAVGITPDGEIWVDNHHCPNAELKHKASEALQKAPSLRAVIQADGATPHRRVIEVMDELKLAGIDKVAFGALRYNSQESSSQGTEVDSSRVADSSEQ